MGKAAIREPVLVVGAGYVGLVTAVGLAGLGHRVHLVEIRRDRLDMLRRGIPPIHEAGLPAALTAAASSGALTVSAEPTADAAVALVCVGTPIGADGRSDLSELRTALSGLVPYLGPSVPLVIRSTVPPGSTRLAVEWSGVPPRRVFTNPEFLRQGTALDDFRRPSRIVIGRFPDADPVALALVESLYAGIEAPRLVVDVAAAELIKNGANAFLALKLSFANEIASLSEEYGADVEEVIGGIALDPRIGTQYMRPSFGFGGSCLPKELQALAAAGVARGLSMDVTMAASSANAAQQARFAGRIETLLDGLEGRTIGLLGLAFKAGTDDVRESPAVALASRLIAGGAKVRAYDPQAGHNALLVLPELAVVASPAEALTGADAAVIATEWPEFRDLDWDALRDRLRQPLLVDGRRLLDGAAMEALGYRYEAVGRSLAEDRPALQLATATSSRP
jgi:UDPglucose 6-dehydrogenase